MLRVEKLPVHPICKVTGVAHSCLPESLRYKRVCLQKCKKINCEVFLLFVQENSRMCRVSQFVVCCRENELHIHKTACFLFQFNDCLLQIVG